MLFEDIESIKKLTIEQKTKLLNSNNRYKLKSGLHRSNMMLNPLNLKHLNQLDILEADAVTLNLEDAIAPTRKKEALLNIALALSKLKKTNSEIIIRVNQLNKGGLEEIKFLKDFCFNAVNLSSMEYRSHSFTRFLLG